MFSLCAIANQGIDPMVANVARSLTIDLNQFKLHLHLDQKVELTLHFGSPSRRFYLSVIGLVVHEMKKKGRVFPVPLEKHIKVLALLNETVGRRAGSSDKAHLIPRIYRKWKDALPDLQNAPLFKVIGRKKRYVESADRVYAFSEDIKDIWANLFDYKGSHGDVRLRFSIDRLDLGLDETIIIYDHAAEAINNGPWERFIAHLHEIRRETLVPKKMGAHSDERIHLALGRITLNPGRWPRNIKWSVLCVILILVVTTSIFIVRNVWSPPRTVEQASVERLAFPLPDKPSIAVLPFRNLSDEPEQDYFCDGLTQDIITGLSKISDLFVIAPFSTFTYKGRPINLRQVSEELGVRHLLEGSVRWQKDRIRISAQLFDMFNGTTLWAERYDRKLQDIFAIQDQITINILSALRYKLTKAEKAHVLRKSTQNLQAYLKYLEGTGYMYLFKNDEGLNCFDDAIALDSRFAEAYAWKSFAHMRSCWFGPRINRVEHYVKAMESAKRCRQLDDELASCNIAMGLTYLVNFDFISALREERLAVERWPNSAQAAWCLASALRAAGRHEGALKEIERALRINPARPIYALQVLGIVYFDLGRDDEAIAACKKVLQISPLQLPAYMILALAYKRQGHEEEARSAAVEILRIRPDFIAKDYTMIFRKKTVNDINAMLNGLFDDVEILQNNKTGYIH